MLQQYIIEKGEVQTAAEMTNKATEVAKECEQILHSPVFNVNFGHFFEFECEDCKTQIRRRIGSFTPEQGVVCPKCHAVYDVETIGEDKVRFLIRQSKYNCPQCGAENWVSAHHVADGTTLVCATCHKNASIEQRFVIVLEK